MTEVHSFLCDLWSVVGVGEKCDRVSSKFVRLVIANRGFRERNER